MLAFGTGRFPSGSTWAAAGATSVSSSSRSSSSGGGGSSSSSGDGSSGGGSSSGGGGSSGGGSSSGGSSSSGGESSSGSGLRGGGSGGGRRGGGSKGRGGGPLVTAQEPALHHRSNVATTRLAAGFLGPSASYQDRPASKPGARLIQGTVAVTAANARLAVPALQCSLIVLLLDLLLLPWRLVLRGALLLHESLGPARMLALVALSPAICSTWSAVVVLLVVPATLATPVMAPCLTVLLVAADCAWRAWRAVAGRGALDCPC
ncbi:hypothetical protein MNEG_2326 [Monoraphidium neglectum]|uniref:Uncharacterized protein n=1 Tax=Monoraphidium neglectum TaxID=145388 RepID=A0A0D2NLS5_9CHLO|nr:hypothetical protein MNEG_2326 [Monoraphidium neglectum]KIZ05626.1 hypothetical protein MNEG_2326 [Monoraphidium neglectum]|eukprot:XP_013904645.1 hypothetical protein MNEG_2326 [Monoraphidium neglectum]